MEIIQIRAYSLHFTHLFFSLYGFSSQADFYPHAGSYQSRLTSSHVEDQRQRAGSLLVIPEEVQGLTL